jgi:PAS domain-containing protein
MLDLAPFVIATALVVAIAAVLLVEAARMLVVQAAARVPVTDERTTRLVFDRERLVDLTPGAELWIAGHGGAGAAPALADAIDAFAHRFPDLRERLEAMGASGRARLLASDGSAHLEVVRRGDSLRLDLEPLQDPGEGLVVDPVEFAALKAQLVALRGVAEAFPYPMWCVDAEGAVSWVNCAYLDRCRDHLGPDSITTWPLPHLFDVAPCGRRGAAVSRRLWLEADTGEPAPFDVTAAAHGTSLLCSAVPADGAVRTENSLRDFVQTLTKTFAQITIGLAVFSRERRLVLFNPALVDLTGLRPEALAARPTLFEFLDTLRDRRLMPEPKDYKAWRQRLADLRGAAQEQLIETWQLPDGRSLRVTAVPQPGGASALLFEDITSQMALNRTFRGTLEMHQLVLDRRAAAIAVFAADGALVLCNEPYDRLWNTRLSESVAPLSLAEALDSWKAATQPTPVWEGFPRSAGDGPWSAEVMLADGRPVECRVEPLQGGCLMVEFAALAGEGSDDGQGALPRRLRLMA